jgi:hypothetical protein
MAWRHQLPVEASAAAVSANVHALVVGKINDGAALWKCHQLTRGGKHIDFLVEEVLFDRVQKLLQSRFRVRDSGFGVWEKSAETPAEWI